MLTVSLDLSKKELMELSQNVLNRDSSHCNPMEEKIALTAGLVMVVDGVFMATDKLKTRVSISDYVYVEDVEMCEDCGIFLDEDGFCPMCY